jgi:SAM-dependent methyltransferase
MSRKYLNDRYCVRCGRTSPTPYLTKHINLFGDAEKVVLDLGCGNGRNTNFLRKKGFQVIPVDMVNDFGSVHRLGVDRLPARDSSVDIILANYVFMFLNKKERRQLIGEIKRVAASGCIIMVELYAAKDSETPTKEASIKLQRELFDVLGWKKLRYSQERFIAER